MQKQPFINFLSKGKWIKSIIALFLQLRHFLKEMQQYLVDISLKGQKEGGVKVRISFVAYWGSTPSVPNVKYTLTFQQIWSPVNLTSSRMIQFLFQYETQCKEWFSSVVNTHYYIHSCYYCFGWPISGGLQASRCQIQPDSVKYCCVKFWILVREVVGPWNHIISRQYLWADRVPAYS